MQKRASERVTVPPELRSEVRFSPKGEQLSTSARARGTVTTNTLLQRGEGSSDQHAAAARRGRVTRYVDVAADALPPLPEVLDERGQVKSEHYAPTLEHMEAYNVACARFGSGRVGQCRGG